MLEKQSLGKQLDQEKLKKAADMLKGIAHPVRISILELLEYSAPLAVSEITKKLGVEQAVTSHHLKILRERGVLRYERKGKNCLYRLKQEKIKNIIHCLQDCQTE